MHLIIILVLSIIGLSGLAWLWAGEFSLLGETRHERWYRVEQEKRSS